MTQTLLAKHFTWSEKQLWMSAKGERCISDPYGVASTSRGLLDQAKQTSTSGLGCAVNIFHPQHPFSLEFLLPQRQKLIWSVRYVQRTLIIPKRRHVNSHKAAIMTESESSLLWNSSRNSPFKECVCSVSLTQNQSAPRKWRQLNIFWKSSYLSKEH